MLGLNLKGNIYFILTIRARSFNDAVVEWARLTNHMDSFFDQNNQTYFGWPIVETEIKSLERKNDHP